MRKYNYKFLITCLFLVLFIANANTQWNCRSRLASNLKPISENVPLLWASEITIGEAKMTDRTVMNEIVYGGLDYTLKNHRLYVDGGFKRWKSKPDSARDGEEYFKNRVGLREMFYMYKKNNLSLIAGLHTVELGDYFLMNERAWGLSYIQRNNALDWKISAGTVTQDFARNGTFCSVYYIYNIFKDREYNFLGETFGETNYAGGMLRWTPSMKKTETTTTGDDEFSEFEDFSEETSEEFNYVKEVGLLAYNEFGSKVDGNELMYGAFTELNIPGGFYLRAQLMQQSAIDNNATIYHGKLGFRHDFNKIGRTDLFAGYYGTLGADSTTYVTSSYNNLFIGEVIRLDAADMPMYQIAFKHSLTKSKLSIKAQYVGQLEDDEMKEIDIELNKRLGEHIGVAVILSQIQANVLVDDFYMARMEIRAVF